MELSERNKLVIARVENFNYILRTAMLILLGTLALCIFASGNAHIWPLSITIIGATLYGILAGNTAINDLDALREDMDADTICGKFPKAELPLKRRLRCVAEYLIRSGEFNKVRDKDGKLVKKRGILGKMVVLYQPMPKLLESLTRQGLLKK